MREFTEREPVLTAQIVGFVLSFITLLISLGFVDLSGEQYESLKNFVELLVPLVMLVAPVMAGIFARQFVTPVSNPRTGDNKPATLVPLE